MSDRAQSEQNKPSTNLAFPALSFWIDSCNDALAGWTQSGNGMLKKAAELSDDIVSFSRTQLQTDLDAWQAVISCRSPSDLLECQRQFANTVGSQYLDQANKITSRMLTLMADAALSPLREQARNGAG